MQGLKVSQEEEEEKGEEKKKQKKKEKEIKDKTVRYSGSSFEAGALSPLESSFPTTGTIKKKQSIRGLEIPASIRRTVQDISSTSSTSSIGPAHPPVSMKRLSAESAHLTLNTASTSAFLVFLATPGRRDVIIVVRIHQ